MLTTHRAPVQAIDHGAQIASRRDPIARLDARVLAVLIAASALIASPAQAHEGTGLAGGFVAGVLHPLQGPDHMLAMISVGLWGAFLGRPLVYALPMLFPAAMAVGGALGMAGVGFPPVELGIAVSVITLGALILFAVRAPIFVACAIVAIFALFHGYAHGAELPSAADPVGYSAGFVLSTGLLHLVGIGFGLLRAVPAGTIALRAAGGVIALSGAWFLMMAVTA
ncbi:MAG: HupE/UreJ family protein [Sphingomonas bacterium]|nr:HupE/UreJ family protein [Sphingomonas bacterium]